jgi:hypothetical protein
MARERRKEEEAVVGCDERFRQLEKVGKLHE